MAIDLNTGPNLPPKTDYAIGCVGAGFIMKDIHLVAYAEAGFNVVAIASRTPANARTAAEERGVGTVHDTWEASRSSTSPSRLINSSTSSARRSSALT